MALLTQTVKDQLKVRVFDSRENMGLSAAADVAHLMRELSARQEGLNMLFASAPSQNEFLEALALDREIDWSKVTVFHLDEYLGLASDAPQNFGRFLKVRLFERVKPRQVWYIDEPGLVQEELVRRYTRLLQEHRIDIACIGIGENGHIAFNDPHVADFADPKLFKVVELDQVCRQQQVNDKCFTRLEDVPCQAVTVTMPGIFLADYLFCMVPGATKRAAVQRTLNGEISTRCPATMLRSHPRATLYLDALSGVELI